MMEGQCGASTNREDVGGVVYIYNLSHSKAEAVDLKFEVSLAKVARFYLKNKIGLGVQLSTKEMNSTPEKERTGGKKEGTDELKYLK